MSPRVVSVPSGDILDPQTGATAEDAAGHRFVLVDGRWRPAGEPRSRGESSAAKARRLLASGRVLVVLADVDRIAARVRGDHDRYDVARDPDGWSCTCPAMRGRCSHVLAVKLVTVDQAVRP